MSYSGVSGWEVWSFCSALDLSGSAKFIIVTDSVYMYYMFILLLR